jgi:O-antigen/teichoic acid export membrane protein
MNLGALEVARSPAHDRLVPRLARTVWPLADQVLISASNFCVMILLARTLSVEAFGEFTLAYAVLLLAQGIQSGIVTQPHNVLGAAKQGDAYRVYTTSTAVCQLLLVLLLGLLSSIAAGAAFLMGWQSVWLFLAIVPAVVTWQAQHFFRRLLYTEERLGSALINDLICCLGQVLAVTMLWRVERLTAPAALYCVSGASAIAAAFGAWQMRHSFFHRCFSWEAFRENWQYGKWLLGGKVIGEWLSSHLLTFLAAVALGTAAAGVLRAVHTVMGPTRMLAQVLDTVLPTQLARTLAEQGATTMRASLTSVCVWAIPALAVYCLVAAVAAEPLMRLLFGAEYGSQGPVLALYSLAAFIGYLTMIASAVLKARQLTHQIFVSELISLLVMPIGLLLIPSLGIYGVLSGLIAADIALLFLLCSPWQRAERTGERGKA